MLRPRIIPVLLIQAGGLVKTVNFGTPKYLGDPINAVRIFNEKEVDEIVILDIDATRENREPNYKLIGDLAAECRMPLCYGGGVKKLEQVQKIISLGVEKVAISAVAVNRPSFISEVADKIGRQSIVVVMDVKRNKNLSGWEIFTHNATHATGLDPVVFAKEVEALGAGEVVLNSIDRDGTMAGYDLQLISEVRNAISLPLTAIGGVGSLDDLEDLIRTFGIIGAAAGSLFVFKGKYRAVLINYPSRNDKDFLCDRAKKA